MPVFRWEGKTRGGQMKKGTMNAIDEQVVELRLKQQGIIPSSVSKAPGQIDLSFIPIFAPKLGPKSLIIFTRQFATMIDAGLPLVQGLEILAAQTDDPVLQKTLFVVKNDVESGSTFSGALEKHPGVFDTLYCSLVSAGEMGGILDTILDRLAGYIEGSERLKKKVKGAMTYPIGILVVAIIVIAVLMIKVVPTFATMFSGMGGTLPGPTQLLIEVSDFFVNYYLHIAVVLTVIYVSAKALFAWKTSRRFIDMFALKIPVVGDAIRKVAVSRFTRTMGTMIGAGIPIVQAMEVVEKTAGNVIIEEGIRYVKEKVTEGKNLAEPLMQVGVFPPMVVQMIAVGESTGALDAMLAKIADFYDEEVDAAVGALIAIMEPVMMVFLAGIVGFVLISLYMPIFTMGQNM